MNNTITILAMTALAFSASACLADDDKNIDEVVTVATKLDQTSSHIDIDVVQTAAPVLNIKLSAPVTPATTAPVLAAPAPVTVVTAVVSE